MLYGRPHQNLLGRLVPLGGDDDGSLAFDDAGLFGSDGFNAGAQPRFMIEIDGRDHAHDGRDRVGGVEPAAEPDFDDGDFDLRTPEQLERHRRGDLEEGRLHLEAAVGAQAFDGVAQVRDGGEERVPLHGPAVDDEPLRKVDQMRRGVPRRPMSGGAQRGVHHRRDRALAVGAGDVHRSEAALGVAEPGDERGNVAEAEFDAELL